jgi:hypothetical protein
MKKIYLLALTAISSFACAQTPKVLNGPNVAQSAVKTHDATQPSPVKIQPKSNFTNRSLGKKSFLVKVGETQNDQQTNASIYPRLHVFNDGKASLTWTTSADPAPYATRGAGYNHFNGTAWGAPSSDRIEPERTGFPCYAYNPTTNEEIITSHIVKSGTGIAGGILMNRKPGVGPGTWTSTKVLDTVATVPGFLWNQTAITGDYMLVIGSYTDSSEAQPNRVVLNGVRTPQVYSRYQFSTNSWLVKNQPLPGYDGTRYYSGGGDNYSIDANGTNVAILMGGSVDDMALWKSTDAGATWTKTIIDSFPYPRFSGNQIIDTTETNDGSVHVKLDNSGVAHCFWARNRIIDNNDADDSWSFFPGTNGIVYWSDNMNYGEQKIIAGMLDENASGSLELAQGTTGNGARYGGHTLATMPSAAIAVNGTIYLTYSAPTEDDISTDDKNYRDIYCTVSRDGGKTWSDAKNLTAWISINSEQIFPSLAKRVDGRIHLTFLQKISIGRYDATNNPGAAGTHDVMYMVMDTADISGTINSVNSFNNELFTVGQNYPNPFNNYTNIPVNFKANTAVNLSVIDLLGKEVFNQNYSEIAAGASTLELNLGSIPTGIYLYTIEAEGMKVTRRMIVE